MSAGLSSEGDAPPRTRPVRVLVVGHVTLDRYGAELLPGGGAYYAARVYAALGAQVLVITRAASDFPRQALAGTEAVIAPSARTTVFANAYAESGARTQRVEAVAPALQPGLAPESWRSPDLLHLAPVLGEVDLVAWTAVVAARRVGIGVQGWVRAARPDGTVEGSRWQPASSELRRVDVACAGEDDLRGQEDLAARLVAAVPLVALTHGRAGCELVQAGSRTRVGVVPATEVDPTGAGDAFSAGLFLGLAEGMEPASAARLGAAAASVVVEGQAGATLARAGEARARARAVPVGR